MAHVAARHQAAWAHVVAATCSSGSCSRTSSLGSLALPRSLLVRSVHAGRECNFQWPIRCHCRASCSSVLVAYAVACHRAGRSLAPKRATQFSASSAATSGQLVPAYQVRSSQWAPRVVVQPEAYEVCAIIRRTCMLQWSRRPVQSTFHIWTALGPLMQ